MKNTATQTKYRVETDGETPCLSGHGIEQVHDGAAILAAIEAGFAAGGVDVWDAPEFEAARELTAAAGCEWDFAGWHDTAQCIRTGSLGGTLFVMI